MHRCVVSPSSVDRYTHQTVQYHYSYSNCDRVLASMKRLDELIRMFHRRTCRLALRPRVIAFNVVWSRSNINETLLEKSSLHWSRAMLHVMTHRRGNDFAAPFQPYSLWLNRDHTTWWLIVDESIFERYLISASVSEFGWNLSCIPLAYAQTRSN